MTSDEQPTRPLTDAELVAIHDAYTKSQKVVSGIVGDPTGPYAKDCGGNAIRHVGHLLAEVDRLRAEIDALSSRIDVTAVINETIGELADERNKLRARIDRLSAENSAHIGVNMACNAKIDRLQSERDALVRKLGLDWGPDEFGDLDAATNGQQSCGDASIWSCALGDHCVCKKTKHGGRHECACGSWWFLDK